MNAENVTTFAPGTAVCVRDSRGFIAAYQPNPASVGRSFMIGSGAGFQQIRGNYTIVLDSGTIFDAPDTSARQYVEEARRIGWRDIPDHAERYQAAMRAKDEARDKARREAEDAAAALAKYREEIRPKIPPGAKAVILATLEQDESDSMTGYFHAKSVRTVILGFSSHDRDLFPELRKAARNFPETAALADAPESAEHREKYSMGGGYYLKNGYRYSSGWKVHKSKFYGNDPANSVPMGEWRVPLDAPAMEARTKEARPALAAPSGLRIEKHKHTKHGFDMWLAILPDRVSREEFDRLNTEAKARGGWYSRPWAGTPGGFAFKSEAAALAFAGMAPGGDDPGGGEKPEARDSSPEAPRASPGIAEKLRALADAMHGEIAAKLGDRLANTPKRQRQAAEARIEGRRLQRAQKGLLALADHHDAGTVPDMLRKVTTKAAALALAESRIDRSNAGYYDAGIDTETPYRETPEALAFWALIGTRSEAERKADDVRRRVEALKFANIPGYFPTPRAIVSRMLDHAALEPGMLVLEPSAGHGAILDCIAADQSGARLVAFERNHTLAGIIRDKGYTVDCCDFTEREPEPVFDRVLMNPPFENGQDAAHVRIAFAHLKPGGRLVAIMSPGPFFRSDERSRSFRKFFEDNGGEKYDLPAGAFRESGTDVATVLVVIGKE